MEQARGRWLEYYCVFSLFFFIHAFLILPPAPAQVPYMVKDITTSETTSSNSSPSNFVQLGRDVFFTTRLINGRTLLNRLNLDLKTAWPVTGNYNEIQRLATYKGSLYFAASTTTPNYTGSLWKVDTSGCGALVKEMSATSDGTLPPYGFVEGNGILFFIGSSSGTGSELWKTDGTTQSTVLVKDIRPGAQSSFIRDMIWFNDKLYFWANNGTNGTELWSSDGTGAGTVMVKDIYPGVGDGYHDYVPAPVPMLIWGNRLLFAAKDQPGTNLLWLSDGTSSGTQSFHGPALPIAWSIYNSSLYFMTREQAPNDCALWMSNGTIHGTTLIKEFSGGDANFVYPQIKATAGGLLFTVRDASVGNELWISDGTEPGTRLVEDIWLDFQGSNPTLPVEWGGRLYFAADDGFAGRELWTCDSSGGDVRMVKDIHPDSSSMEGSAVFSASDFLMFAADDGVHGIEPWVSDGTGAGTQLMQDMDAMPQNSAFTDMIAIRNELFAGVSRKLTASAPFYLWRSDGTNVKTLPVTNKVTIFDAAFTPTFTYNGSFSRNVNNVLFFHGLSAGTGWEIWKSDGTDGGTVLVKDITAGTSNTTIITTAASGNLFYFRKSSATEARGDDELWRSDGTSAGTFALKAGNLDPVSAWAGTGDGKGSFCFVGKSANWGSELWLTDGTVAGTQRATSISTSTQHAILAEGFYWTNAFYFVDQKEDGWRLRKLDPVTKATTIVAPLDFALPSGVTVRSIDNFTVVENQLFFRMAPSNASYDQQIWRTDGTAGGTRMIASATRLGFLTEYKGLLYFTDFLNQTSNTILRRLWRSDGTEGGMLLIKEIPENIIYSFAPLRAPGNACGVAGDILYFSAIDDRPGAIGYRQVLWKSDGTPAGTVRCDLVPGVPLYDPQRFTRVGGSLYLEASDGVHGQELWRIEGPNVTRVGSWAEYQ